VSFVVNALRRNPHLYEINTWPWLDALSRHDGRLLTLGGVAEREWDVLHALGIDLVYLMGIWRRSPLGRELARTDARLAAEYTRALPHWTVSDVIGSAYSIVAYEPDPRIGTWDEVDEVREKLHARGMQLVVDFIPNHTGFDHPWVRDHPERYVRASPEAFRRDPSRFRAVETASGGPRFVACGRDPNFPPWTDVAQLDYFNDDTRAAMIGELRTVAQHADGARCDMAMLALSDVFSGTWGAFVNAPAPATEFWSEARAAVPGFVLIAEVYWDLEWRLQQLGFDFTYDKRLYDRLVHGTPREVLAHLASADGFQQRSVRFIENHDELRSADAFGDRVTAAAVVVSTLQGLRFYHDGQFEGRRARLPVQLGVMPDEPVDEALLRFYRRLLAIADSEPFHDAEWRLLELLPAGDDSHESLVAWRWRGDRADRPLRIVVVNLGDGPAQGHVVLAGDLPASGDTLTFEDLLDGRLYPWPRATLDADGGLYVRLERGQSHIFAAG
jgi:Alpha amylase, catalytic domain